MILWVILFLLVVATSFVLAVKSMKDFTDIPQNAKQEYGLFLIRKIQGFNATLLSHLNEKLLESGSILSIERLFKGKKSALVVYGPRKILLSLNHVLDLLELEDYTDVNVGHISAWEIGIKDQSIEWMSGQNIFANLPQFLDSEQFWWQLILNGSFNLQITAVLISADGQRRTGLTQSLQSLNLQVLIKLPKAFSNPQFLDFYQKRSLRGTNKQNNTLAATTADWQNKLLQLIMIKNT